MTSIVADGYAAITGLVDDGARFDETAPGRWSLTREGGHSRRRIIHAGGDATGAEVQRALDHAAAHLDVRRDHVALQVLRDDAGVTGVLVRNDDGLGVIHAPSVVLATGGLGHLFSATTNPEGSTGDGVALALWAGLPVADLEFVQFHPTMLFDGRAGGRRPLITEALRGEGAILLDARGESVTAGVHPMGDLAPRDVVAAAIDRRLTTTGDACVYLDARGVEDFARRFPTVNAACLAAGIDATVAMIPVVPGAHYSCGGVVTDVHGRTELPGLFAAGEVARTGMHGANRLASNSLLEGLVVGRRAGLAAVAHAADAPARRAVVDPVRRVALARTDLQRAMTRHASVVRDAAGLSLVSDLFGTARPRDLAGRADVEDAALTAAATAVVAAALDRAESRGSHHRTDHPDPDPARASSAVVRLDAAGVATVTVPRAGVLLMELTADERDEARSAIRRGLDEDLRYGPDVTSLATVPADATTTASMVTRQPGVAAGVDVALLVLDEVVGADRYRVVSRVKDGTRIEPGESLLVLEAPTRGLLTAERTMLNMVCHLSGIASTTAAWVEAVEGTGAKIRDTRKTLPGLRVLQKYAVRVGGGVNHRMGLGDAALIKDNHVAAAGSVVAALRAVRETAPGVPVEVEVDSLEQLDEILGEDLGAAPLILLDNFPVWMTQMAVQRRAARAGDVKLESSGNLSLDNAAAYAGTGVDYLAVGALTHSVRVLDVGLDL